jgi:hypothetical protein
MMGGFRDYLPDLALQNLGPHARLARELLDGPLVQEPEGNFWQWAYSPGVLQALC